MRLLASFPPLVPGLLLLGALALSAYVPTAHATDQLTSKNPTTGFHAEVRFAASCALAVPAYDFGQIASLDTQLTMTQNIAIRCPPGLQYRIRIDDGVGNEFAGTLVPVGSFTPRVLRRETSPGVFAPIAESAHFNLLGPNGVLMFNTTQQNGLGDGTWQQLPFTVEISPRTGQGNANHTIGAGRYVARLGVVVSF
jgi:hypothetical protein